MSEMTLIYKEQKSEYTTTICKNYSNVEDKPEIFNPFTSIIGSLKYGFFSVEKKFHDEKTFLENYANPLANPLMTRKTIIIEENENKIAIKVYNYVSSRSTGQKYFKVRKHLNFLTFNFKKKLFYYGEINSKKKRKINQKLVVNLTDITQTLLYSKLKSIDYLNYENFDDSQILNTFLNRIIERLEIKVDINQKSDKKYYEILLKNKKVKYPDAFNKFCSFYQPLKELKRYDNNLVSYFMKKTGLSGKKARNLLNKYENLDIDSMINIQKWLGVDFFNRLKDEIFLSKEEYSTLRFTNFYVDALENIRTTSKKELDNIVDILNTSRTEESLSVILDHLNFQKKLKKYGEHHTIKSKNFEDFVFEHSEISALLQSYKNGYIIRDYGDDSIMVEDKIFTQDHTYFPKLLLNTDQYEEESSTQHNCVRTYSEKPYCFIISLRKDSQTSNERATLEYRISNEGVQRVQSRAKYNKLLSVEWEEPMNELDAYVNYLYRMGYIKLPKMTKKFRNGKIQTTQAVFKKMGDMIHMTPTWDNDIDLKNEYMFFDDLP